MEIIVITTENFIKDEAELIEAALANGVDRVHIRKPNSQIEDFDNLLSLIPQSLLNRVSIHDHFVLTEKYKVGGIHLNRRNPSAPSCFEGLLSCSCHSADELIEQHKYDYIFLSPIYNSISKNGYNSNFTNEMLLDLKADGLINERIYALGGVTNDKLFELHNYGFGGVCVLGYLWNDTDITKFISKSQLLHKQAKVSANFDLQFISHKNDSLNYIQGIESALKGGCKWIQLRMKGVSDEEFVETAHIVEKMCREHDAVFLLNDRVELVNRCNADGVHIGKNDMSPSEARKILGDSKIIGGTANTLEDIDYLTKQGVDYIGMGPYRFTSTKEKLSPILGLEGYISAVNHRINTNNSVLIVAIGGITANDIPAIIKSGINGIALSGTILNSSNPQFTTTEILETIKISK